MKIKHKQQNNSKTVKNKITVGTGLEYARGITLIALVITIIVLLILASVAINLTLGDNGIFRKSKEAKTKYEVAQYIDRIEAARGAVAIEYEGIVTLDTWIEQIYVEKIVPRGNITKKNEESAIVETEEGYLIEITADKVRYIENSSDPEQPIKKEITNITLDKNGIQLQEGDKETLTITIEPEGIENAEVEWTSDNTEIATVNTQGEVTGIKEGTAIITVTAKNDNTINDKCTVTVTRVGIRIGDYINYTPDSTTPYSKDKLTASIVGASHTADLDQEKLEWQILRIYDDGKIDLIGSIGENGSAHQSIKLKGYSGYNNGVYVLNDVCKHLYSKPSKGISARSVNIEDAEKWLTEGKNRWTV